MEDKCLTVKNEVVEAPDLCYAENIEGRFFTSPKQMVENHYDGYPIKYAKDLEGYVSGNTEDIKTTLPEIEHFMAISEHSESDIVYKFSDVNNINGTTSVFNSNEDFTSSGSSQNKRKKFEKGVHPFSCDICGKNYSSKKFLTIHRRIHTGECPFSCDICGKNFTCTKLLTIHKRIHSGVRPYVCDICDKKFTQVSHLKIHKIVHTGVRAFTCDICGKTCSIKQNLVRHKKIHTGERPFKCDICGKSFVYKVSLRIHMTCHAGERPVSCDICGNTLTSESRLRRHMKLHSGVLPFSCDTCGKNFICEKYLTIHNRGHTGEGCYTCDFCGRAFTYKRSLERHMKLHARADSDFTAEEYCCRECDKRFRSKSDLEHHKKATHLRISKNRSSMRKTHGNKDNNQTEDIHTKFEGNIPENLTLNEEIYFSEFADNINMKNECLPIKNEVVETPDLCNLEDIQEKFITSPKQMMENHDENIKKYIQLLEGYMSGEGQGSTQEIETALQEIDNFIEMVESSKSDIKNEPSNISNVNESCK